MSSVVRRPSRLVAVVFALALAAVVALSIAALALHARTIADPWPLRHPPAVADNGQGENYDGTGNSQGIAGYEGAHH